MKGLFFIAFFAGDGALPPKRSKIYFWGCGVTLFLFARPCECVTVFYCIISGCHAGSPTRRRFLVSYLYTLDTNNVHMYQNFGRGLVNIAGRPGVVSGYLRARFIGQFCVLESPECILVKNRGDFLLCTN